MMTSISPVIKTDCRFDQRVNLLLIGFCSNREQEMGARDIPPCGSGTGCHPINDQGTTFCNEDVPRVKIPVAEVLSVREPGEHRQGFLPQVLAEMWCVTNILLQAVFIGRQSRNGLPVDLYL